VCRVFVKDFSIVVPFRHCFTNSTQEGVDVFEQKMEFSRRKSPSGDDPTERGACLSKPATPASNDGRDNENSDLIVYQNDILRAGDDRCAYKVLGSLGSGTFGQVLRVQKVTQNDSHERNNNDDSNADKENGNKVSALKIIKNHPAYFHQAHVEIGILHMLNTRCDPTGEKKIVKLLDQFVCHNHLCLVFELLDINLYEFLRKNKFRGVSLRVLRELMVQLLNALDVLREANVIHCDIKPENILLKSLSSTEVKLVDFGSACFQNRTVYQYIQSRFYRSPEVLLGTPYGMPIDMWSLGCVAAEMFLGLPILPGASEFDLLNRMCETIEPPPDSMLHKARHRHKYFVRENNGNTSNNNNNNNSSSSFSDMNLNSESDSDMMKNKNNMDANGNGESNYRLLNLQQYEERSGKRAAVGKRYFHQKKLADIIFGAPYKDLGVDGPGSRERENAIEEQRLMRASFLDFLFGMLTLDPTSRWTPKQALLHPYITGEPFDAKNPFKPPSCMETTSEETRKEHQRSAAKMAAAVSESAKREVTAAKKPKQTVQTPFPDFVPPPLEQQPVPAGIAANAAAVIAEVPAAVSAQQQQPVVGGLAAAFASASATATSVGNTNFLQAQQMQTAAAANAAMVSQASPGQTQSVFGVGSFGQSPGGTQFLGNHFVGSPHAMNSAALHPLHFGQSPPTSQMQNLSMQRQHAVAAKAAAAVQLPVVYASPLGPGRGTLGGEASAGGMNTASEAARAATAAQNALNVGNNNLIRNNFGISRQYKMQQSGENSSGGSSSSTFSGLPQSMPRQSASGGFGGSGNAGWWGPGVVSGNSASISNKEKGAFSPMSRVSGFASPSGGSGLKTVREGGEYVPNTSPPPQMNKEIDMDANWDPTLSEPLEDQHQQNNSQTTTTDLYKYASSAPTDGSFMQEKKRKSDR